MGINQSDIAPLGLKQVNTGAAPNDGQGDDLRTAFEKHNYNMQVLSGHIAPRLGADQTYYVSTTGDDLINTGTTISSPFATIAKAITAAYSLNINGKVIKIRLLDGTYSEAVTINNPPTAASPTQPIQLYIEGNIANPDAVTLNLDTTLGYCFDIHHNVNVHLSGLRFVNTDLTLVIAQYFIGIHDGALVAINKCVFTALSALATDAAHIYISNAKLEIWGAYAISGGARQHIKAEDGSITDVSNTTGTPYPVTVTNNPVFQSFIGSYSSSTITLASLQVVYNGSASGLAFNRDFDARVNYANNLPSGLSPGTQNPAYLEVGFCTSPPANDVSNRIVGADWVTSYVDSRISALETIINNLGDGLADAVNGLATVPKGAMMFWTTTSPPPGFLLCLGQALSRNTYSALFGVIGTTFGIGDGSSTFNLPNAASRFILCAGEGAGLTARPVAVSGGNETHTLTINELPAHTHVVVDPGHVHALSDPGHTHNLYDPGHTHVLPGQTYDTDAGEGNNGDGSAYRPTGNYAFPSGTNMAVYGAFTGLSMGAAGTGVTLNNTGSGVAHNNMPPFLTLYLMIKT